MLRSLFLATAMTLMATPAMATHPDDTSPTEKTIIDKTLKSTPKLPKSLKGQLPSPADIENIMSEMPDLNALMGGMMEVMQDEKFQRTMKNAGKTLEHKMESSGAMKKQANGLPDFNAAMGAMLSMMSDEETMGGMLEMMGEMAKTLEEHIPEAKKGN